MVVVVVALVSIMYAAYGHQEVCEDIGVCCDSVCERSGHVSEVVDLSLKVVGARCYHFACHGSFVSNVVYSFVDG